MSVTEEEKVALAKRVGPHATIVCTALVKLYLSSPNPAATLEDDPILASFPRLTEREWTYTHIMGFVVLLTDHNHDSLYIRLYDFKRLQRRFEYEVYHDMDYKMLDPQFHAFEMENCVAGLSFSVKTDAVQFIQKLLALRPSHKDSAATILRKMRSATLSKDTFKLGDSEQSTTEEKKEEEPQYVNCTPEQIKMLMEYQKAKKKYEEDLAKYRAEQEALKKYEDEKRKYEEKFRTFIRANEWGSEASTGSEASSLSTQSMRS